MFLLSPFGDFFPLRGDFLPFRGDFLPFRGDFFPFRGDFLPLRGDFLPFRGDDFRNREPEEFRGEPRGEPLGERRGDDVTERGEPRSNGDPTRGEVALGEDGDLGDCRGDRGEGGI